MQKQRARVVEEKKQEKSKGKEEGGKGCEKDKQRKRVIEEQKQTETELEGQVENQ